MSDNPTPKIKQVHCSLHGFMYGYCSECMRTGERGSVYEVPLPPAPHISEDEIQRVAVEIRRESGEAIHSGCELTVDEIAAILRTLNESRKA